MAKKLKNVRVIYEGVDIPDDYSGPELENVSFSNFREVASHLNLEGEDGVILLSNPYEYDREPFTLVNGYRVNGRPIPVGDGTFINDLERLSDKEGKKIADEYGLTFDFPGYKFRKMQRQAAVTELIGAAVISTAFVLGGKKLLKLIK